MALRRVTDSHAVPVLTSWGDYVTVGSSSDISPPKVLVDYLKPKIIVGISAFIQLDALDIDGDSMTIDGDTLIYRGERSMGTDYRPRILVQ